MYMPLANRLATHDTNFVNVKAYLLLILFLSSILIYFWLMNLMFD